MPTLDNKQLEERAQAIKIQTMFALPLWGVIAAIAIKFNFFGITDINFEFKLENVQFRLDKNLALVAHFAIVVNLLAGWSAAAISFNSGYPHIRQRCFLLMVLTGSLLGLYQVWWLNSIDIKIIGLVMAIVGVVGLLIVYYHEKRSTPPPPPTPPSLYGSPKPAKLPDPLNIRAKLWRKK